MTPLLTQTEILQRQRLNAALSDPTRPRAQGFDKLSDLEAKAKRALEKAEAERQRLSEEQREVDSLFDQLEELKRRKHHATGQQAHFSDLLHQQIGKRDALIGTDQLTPPLAIHIQSEINALADILDAIPGAIERIEANITEIETKLTPLMKGSTDE